MPIIEAYNVDHNAGPRNCEHDLSEKHHPAEVIIHSADGLHQKFLCKRHAAIVLSHDMDRLAMAVVEIALVADKALTIG